MRISKVCRMVSRKVRLAMASKFGCINDEIVPPFKRDRALDELTSTSKEPTEEAGVANWVLGCNDDVPDDPPSDITSPYEVAGGFFSRSSSVDEASVASVSASSSSRTSS